MPDHATEQRKLAAIMFTDMVGYSALAQRNEALALELLEEHRGLLRRCFPNHQGAEIKTTGDGFLLEFPSALAAVQCAGAIQRALAERNQSQPSERHIRIRIGIHLGDVERRENDVFGDGVNIAARLEPLAEPGGICISRAVFEQVQGKVAETMTSLGEVELKNLARPVAVFRVARSNGASDEPPQPQLATRKSQMEKSIAVLPFVNMSADHENEFLSDGISEDLITALSRVKGLRVPARTSAFAFKGKNEDIQGIGQRLRVATVLEGSVRKSGNRLRITAQLINVADGYHLWAEHYDRELKDVFEIQDDITRAIVQALEVQLAIRPDAPLVKAPTQNTVAYELCLRGRDCWNQRGLGLKKAQHYFELALLEDPHYALALAGLADCLSMQVFYDFLAALEAMPRAKAAAEKALTLEPNLAEAHAALAFVKMTFDWDFTGAERSCRQAFELNPNFGPALYWHSGLLSILGRHEAAIAQGERLLELDPLSPIGHAQLAWRFRHARQDDEAIAWGRRLVAQWPDFGLGYVPLAEALGNKGLYSEAVGAARKAAALTGRSGMSLCVLGFASALAGDTVCAQQILAELDDPTRPWARRSIWRAGIQAALGDKTAALASLERAVEERDAVLPWLRTWSPADPLRDEPDFQEVLRKIGLTQ